jgi:hypothetical protein
MGGTRASCDATALVATPSRRRAERRLILLDFVATATTPR